MICQHPYQTAAGTRESAAAGRLAARMARAGAFTLIEVILAVAVTAVILAAIGGVFFPALNLRARTLTVLDESLPVERALNLMSRDLKNIVPPGGMLVGPLASSVTTDGVSEEGGIEMYTTTGLMNDRSPWPEIQKIGYQLRAATNRYSEGQDLYRMVTRNLLPLAVEETEYQWLAGGIADLRFHYFDGADWLETWDSTTQTNLPLAVRVELYLAKYSSPGHEPMAILVPLLAQMRTNVVALEEEVAE